MLAGWQYLELTGFSFGPGGEMKWREFRKGFPGFSGLSSFHLFTWSGGDLCGV